MGPDSPDPWQESQFILWTSLVGLFKPVV